MKMSDLKNDEIDLINNCSDIFNAFDPIVKKKVAQPGTFQKILTVVREFNHKNESKLSTNIIGRQILVNAKMENDIYDALDLNKQEIRNVIINSAYFKKFGKELQLTDQLCFAIALILAALEYKKLKKIEESKLCYLLIFYKPYASRESVFFKYGVKEEQMLYTVEHLSERFDLKRLGTINNVLAKMSAASYNNYFESAAEDWKITDKEFHIIYTSGIASRVNAFIGGIVAEYRKNEGKSLSFDSPAKEVLDKDADSTDFEDADIASDIAIKTNVVNKVIIKITKNPVNLQIAQIAAQYGFESSSETYRQILVRAIDEIVDKMSDKLPLFFSSLIGAFLFRINPKTGEKYTIIDFKSPVFLNVGVDILAGKKSNLKEIDMKTARDIFKEMLEDHSIEYKNRFKETYQRKMQKALAFYWVCLVKSDK